MDRRRPDAIEPTVLQQPADRGRAVIAELVGSLLGDSNNMSELRRIPVALLLARHRNKIARSVLLVKRQVVLLRPGSGDEAGPVVRTRHVEGEE